MDIVPEKSSYRHVGFLAVGASGQLTITPFLRPYPVHAGDDFRFGSDTSVDWRNCLDALGLMGAHPEHNIIGMAKSESIGSSV